MVNMILLELRQLTKPARLHSKTHFSMHTVILEVSN